MTGKRKTTIKDVARASGYSTYTVSSVLNNKGDIGAEASVKIRSVARELNYGILGTVTAQRRMTAQCLGIVLPDSNCLHVGFYNRAMSSFRAVATEHDHDCKFFTEADLLRRMRPQQAGGLGSLGCKGLIIFCPWGEYGQYIESLLDHGVALALIRRKHPRAEGLLQLRDRVDDGMRLLLDHCLATGCQRMVFVGSMRQRDVWLSDWETAFRAYCAVHSQIKDMLVLTEEPGNESERYAALESFIRAKPKQRVGIATWSDPCAVRILSNLQQRGIQAPENISVAGYNDDPVATDIAPQLTTVRIPLEEMVAKACEYLLTYQEEGKLPPAKVMTLPHRLVLRESA